MRQRRISSASATQALRRAHISDAGSTPDTHQQCISDASAVYQTRISNESVMNASSVMRI